MQGDCNMNIRYDQKLRDDHGINFSVRLFVLLTNFVNVLLQTIKKNCFDIFNFGKNIQKTLYTFSRFITHQKIVSVINIERN